MRAWPTLKESTAAVLAGGRTAGSRSSPLQGGARQKEGLGEHLNEATITRLRSILECGNMTGHRNRRSTGGPLSGASRKTHSEPYRL